MSHHCLFIAPKPQLKTCSMFSILSNGALIMCLEHTVHTKHGERIAQREHELWCRKGVRSFCECSGTFESGPRIESNVTAVNL